jgi:hypothetical protein
VADTPQMYQASPTTPGACLRQGEIISDLDQFRLDVATIGTEGVISGRPHRHPLTVLMTQDCDLEQDSRARTESNSADKIVPGLLFCEVVTAAELRGSGINSTVWSQVKVNKHERYQFLQKVEASGDALGYGLPEMGIDFKRYFAIPTDEVYRRLELGEAKRRCILVSPYMEHLCCRFAHFLSRIALPIDHFSE